MPIDRLLNGFEGKLTSSKYATLAKRSQDTAARDIEDLSGKGILARDADGGRSTSYSLIASAADAGSRRRWVMAQRADKVARDGPGWLGLEEDRARMGRIQAIGRKLQGLARKPYATPSDADFETRLRAWHDLGIFPDERLISTVAQAIHRGI